jgi:hypothetical protein
LNVVDVNHDHNQRVAPQLLDLGVGQVLVRDD